MLALIAAQGKGGGDAPEVFATVPWCPTIARKSTGQMPGQAIAYMQSLVAFLDEQGMATRMWEVTPEDVVGAMVASAKPMQSLMAGLILALAVELEFVPQDRSPR